jgi:hypothetical protein
VGDCEGRSTSTNSSRINFGGLAVSRQPKMGEMGGSRSGQDAEGGSDERFGSMHTWRDSLLGIGGRGEV